PRVASSTATSSTRATLTHAIRRGAFAVGEGEGGERACGDLLQYRIGDPTAMLRTYSAPPRPLRRLRRVAGPPADVPAKRLAIHCDKGGVEQQPAVDHVPQLGVQPQRRPPPHNDGSLTRRHQLNGSDA